MEILEGFLLVVQGYDDAEIKAARSLGALLSPLVTRLAGFTFFTRLTSFALVTPFPLVPSFARLTPFPALGLFAALSLLPSLALIANLAGLPVKPSLARLALATLVAPLPLIGAPLAALLPALIRTLLRGLFRWGLLRSLFHPGLRLTLVRALRLRWLCPPFSPGVFRRGFGCGGAGGVAVHALDGTRLGGFPFGAVSPLWLGLRRLLVVLEILVGHWRVVLGVTV
jgi:hypothetical protein